MRNPRLGVKMESIREQLKGKSPALWPDFLIVDVSPGPEPYGSGKVLGARSTLMKV